MVFQGGWVAHGVMLAWTGCRTDGWASTRPREGDGCAAGQVAALLLCFDNPDRIDDCIGWAVAASQQAGRLCGGVPEDGDYRSEPLRACRQRSQRIVCTSLLPG